MATIGSLNVSITASTDKFLTGLNQATSGLGKFAKKFATVGNLVAGMAAGAFASFINGAIEAGGKIQELTSKLNISSEAITALHFAANQLESSAGAVDAALAKMNVTLGQAAMGGKPAAAAIARLGLDLNKVLALPVEHQFLAIVDALNKMPNAATQAAAAQAIFGKGAKEIIPLINAGSEAIIKHGEAAAQAGAVMSTETMEALDNAGDSIAAFSASWEGLKTQIVGFAAPAISAAMIGITETIKFFKAVWFSLQFAMVGGVELIVRAVQKAEEAIEFLSGGLISLDSAGAKAFADDLAKARQGIADKVDTMYGLNGKSGNPLAKPGDSKKVETNTEKTATASERTAAATEKLANQKPVQLAVAGVR